MGRALRAAGLALQSSPIAPWSCHGGRGDPAFQPPGSSLKKGKLHWGLARGCLGGREQEFRFHPPTQSFQAHTNLDLICILPISKIEMLLFFSPGGEEK